MTSSPAAPDSSERQNTPFMVGVYLAVNAVRDAYLLVDGPDCAHMKTQFVQGNHDWLSTLTDIGGRHRVANSAAHPFRMAANREAELVATLRRMAAHPGAGAVLLCPMPMAAITGVDIDRLARDAAGSGPVPVLAVPGRSLSGDWLSGYALTLESLARGLDLEPAPRPGAVAIVGYLWDRNEGDHEANVAELARLLEGVGLAPCSTWLSGGPVRDLRRAAEASLVVSLPYGRRAARRLGRRLGVPVLETALPVGLDGTTRWIRAVAAAAGVEDRAGPFVEEELTKAASRLEWVVPGVFMHRTVALVGDPHLLEAVLGFAEELGCRRGPLVVTARAAHAPGLAERAGELRIAFEPGRTAMDELLGRALEAGEVDLLVANSLGAAYLAGRTPVVELGYPSYFTHALYDRPFLGYRGALALADRMANALRRVDLLRKGGAC